ncbi:aldo/keto reductase [Amycolatopsis sp., V23-08]|uniref:Aldo/keto reductase n=1 Tax=Amycolatopsis heterodermiae TaxID=3110235 RepID=A0ABU5QY10_9PSEU|nr:aldo/keto reductase [Amycolatopsis sp., V23-08]MEA5358807.1 aldo/keto reductase [Amycolatopsis sp., V23-08]
MKKVELGRTGQRVSQVSLGCMTMGTSTGEQTSARILDAYLDVGGDFLDTADCYSWWAGPSCTGGESEALLGRLLKGRRDRVFLATKVSAQPTDLPAARAAARPDGTTDWEARERTYEGASAAVIRRSVEESLRRLGTDHIDLYYIHVDLRREPLEETLSALDTLVRAGKVRYTGWSNVRTWRLEQIHALALAHGWSPPVAVQVQHSYLRPTGADVPSIAGGELLDWLAAHPDVSLAAYSALLRGIYDDAAYRESTPVWRAYAGPDSEARLAAVAKVASSSGATGNQVALAWLLHKGVIPLIGPRTWEHYASIAPAFTLELSEEHVSLLDNA